jgi:hypothetical protein
MLDVPVLEELTLFRSGDRFPGFAEYAFGFTGDPTVERQGP